MKGVSKLSALFYATAAGTEPVRDWLMELTREERRTIGEDIAYVQFKWPIGKPRVDHLHASVWEVRSNLGNRIARTLFAVDDGTMILLNEFIKKTQQMPPEEIALAEKRLREYRHGKT